MNGRDPKQEGEENDGEEEKKDWIMLNKREVLGNKKDQAAVFG